MAYEQRALTSDSFLQIRSALEYDIPRLARQRRVEWATNPRAPTSMVRKEHVQETDVISETSSRYRAFFRITAAGMPSSAPQVSSKMMMWDSVVDHMIMSGRRGVGRISGGNKIGERS